MNRRDLFKRAGKLGAGLGLAAVVGTAVREDEDELLTMARESLAELEAGERGTPWREVRSGFSQVENIAPSAGSTTIYTNYIDYIDDDGGSHWSWIELEGVAAPSTAVQSTSVAGGPIRVTRQGGAL